MAQVENLSSDQVNEPVAKIKNGAGAGASAGFLKVKRLSEKAFLPIRLPNNSAYVLLSAIETKIPGRGMAVVQTDISIAIPEGSYARIGKGSEFPCKEGIIEVGVRVIERDYRGPIEVTLFNHSAEDFEVKQGSRVGQLILDNVAPTTFPEVVEVEYLDETVVDGWCRISGIKLGREVKELLEQVLIDHPEGGTECLKWVLLGWNMRGDQNLIEGQIITSSNHLSPSLPPFFKPRIRSLSSKNQQQRQSRRSQLIGQRGSSQQRKKLRQQLSSRGRTRLAWSASDPP
ncbi:hypothetical protein QQ045_001743 [Rhodiola kirilowii]